MDRHTDLEAFNNFLGAWDIKFLTFDRKFRTSMELLGYTNKRSK